VRAIFVGGQASSPELRLRWGRKRCLFNVYGPTETSILATTTDSTTPLESPSIGRPVFNSRTYVVDKFLQPVPAMSSGELCIGGVGVATAYVDQPRHTADRFRPDPFSSCPGARLYRTGDLARQWHDGQLEFRGRLDLQVKV